jgi:hypothetical protein
MRVGCLNSGRGYFEKSDRNALRGLLVRIAALGFMSRETGLHDGVGVLNSFSGLYE